MAEVSLFLENKYEKPIKVMALIHIGASFTILDLVILLEDNWIPHTQWFTTANRKNFYTKVISKSICVYIFPNLSIKHQFLGSSQQGKIFSMDGIYFLNHLEGD